MVHNITKTIGIFFILNIDIFASKRLNVLSRLFIYEWAAFTFITAITTPEQGGLVSLDTFRDDKNLHCTLHLGGV